MQKLRQLLLALMIPMLCSFGIQAQNTITDIVVNSPDHTILETAVLAAGLEGTLAGPGPFTVFAPTDAAFGALPAGTLDAVLADTDLLTSILTYHVVSGDVRSTDLMDGMVVGTLNGKDITVTINTDGVFINNAQVTLADVVADNGVVHVIDMVLLPPSNTITDIVVNSPDHTILETAVLAAGLEGTLAGPGPFTVFAPTDAAFGALPAGTLDAVLADTDLLTSILTYHVVSGDVRSTDLMDGMVVGTLNGKDITVTINTDGVFINNAQVTLADVVADNGVVHVIDMVLLPPSNTITDIVVNSPDHTILETAVLAAGLEGTLAGPGPFTVFAPTDAAFGALPAGTLDAVLADTDLLTSILTYHVVSGDVRSTDLMDGMVVGTLNGKDITVTINTDGVFINNAQVTVADVVADNGVVHVIDMVLLPPSNTITDIVVNSSDHTILETAVLAAGLEGTLAGPGPFTVFAPTDAAFGALPAGTLDAVLADTDLLTSILTYHVVSGDVRSTDLMDGMVVGTLNGKDITVTINTDGVFINNAQVTVADVVADNGVVHVIDMVLLPPSNTITDIVVNSPDHTILETAVLAAGLEGTLAGPGPFTVFAPTDAAFGALPAGTLDAVLADTDLLTSILTYHVVSGDVRSTDLMDGMVVGTLNGKDITVTINTDGVFINNAQVTVVDVVADNGVVHVIDMVLLPPTNTITDIVVNSPDHTILETAVLAAGLEGTLAGPGPFTVFAPTDAAFGALPAGTLDAVLADTDLLTSILTYHVVSGDVRSTDLMDGMVVGTLNGKDITVTINTDGVFINNAQVTVADVVADNGVVHVIDMVLLPPTTTVVDVIINSPDHNTLAAAVSAAGLVETLQGDGPFTVFAPTDAAFAALPAGTVESLLMDPSGDLTTVLLYHVLGADVRSTDLTDGQTATTLNSQEITVTINTDGVFINDAQVTTADIVTDNGVVHVLDGVLIPVLSSTSNIELATFKIYPNPTSDFIQIEFNGLDTNGGQFRIIDNSGKVVKTVSGNDINSIINISDISSGMYLLEFRNNDSRSYKKLIIE